MNNLLEFTESNLPTAFGTFKIRVYKESRNLETVVLYSENLDTTQPVLTRIHSECLTGDIFSSKKCDCGLQLESALQQIAKDPGVLVYLRQEGRGIGLFDKIKAYQLQENGMDTFDANVAIGHPPDARTYEMAKRALEDLHIDNIKLLTNNPSKIYEMTQMGIEVSERVPIVIEQQEHNESYLQTKQAKFQHLLSPVSHPYTVQFPINGVEDIKPIVKYIESNKWDPLSKIEIAVSADYTTLTTQENLNQLASELKKNNLTPVLHFSFRDVESPITLLTDIQHKFSNFTKIQLNDLNTLTFEVLEAYNQAFQVYLPLDQLHFQHLLNSSQLQDLVRSSNIKLCLDDSKGQGKQTSYESYEEKINHLLSLGLNQISVSGGFGPTNLEVYFKLRDHFKIALSIDAESKLRTNNRYDLQKIQHYLHKVAGKKSDPDSFYQQTKSLLNKSKIQSPDIVKVLDHSFVILPKVFHPGFFPSTAWYASNILDTLNNRKCDFCELGCGAGVVSTLIALDNQKNSVVSLDINPEAIKNTALNASKFGVNAQVLTYTSDVFENVPNTQCFDYVFWSLPFGWCPSEQELSNEDKQVFDAGYQSIQKAFNQVSLYLKPQGKFLVGFSPDLGDTNLLNEFAEMNHLNYKLLAEEKLQEMTTISFQLIEYSKS
ncbi:MAG: GTP cyclohydrolase-2 [Chlamydiia bacterium]|nr:GTP cyclohydrolase-2 [Chlamydiia bacterium]MCH9615857.1 GTP cyclohydrolase-2 [Chlamydiia bacterium]MCH9628740.1 GTP cyclohydrolase-2 [Chlamydiia bacterium]